MTEAIVELETIAVVHDTANCISRWREEVGLVKKTEYWVILRFCSWLYCVRGLAFAPSFSGDVISAFQCNDIFQLGCESHG